MCEQPSTNSWVYEDLLQESRPKIRDLSDLLPYAEYLAAQPERRTTHIGFNGYGSTKAGDRVLIAVDSEYDDRVVTAVAQALRARGARVAGGPGAPAARHARRSLRDEQRVARRDEIEAPGRIPLEDDHAGEK